MGWTFVKQTSNYSTFASDIEAFQKKAKSRVRCPKCRKKINTTTLFKNPQQVGDEPRAVFKLTHTCRAQLVIWND